ncbi:MAG: ABC transporter substrate-binding protein [Spirochaetales bacterium]|nr:ABC transporter substrate-binding protein [Spirochaetales bacterium]
MNKRIIIVFTFMLLFLSACTKNKDESKTIVFGDKTWDSIKVHNRIVAFIIENGLGGYKADFIPGDTIPIVNGVMQGDIDVDMESWHSNFTDIYNKGISSGKLIDLGKNLPDAPQGWYIPRYLVEGDNAPAPDLKTVQDLAKYANLFPDPEDSNRGVIYGGCAGWGQMKVSQEMFDNSGLEKMYNFNIAGSGTALAATMSGSYKKKQGWVGYYWGPSAMLGKLDMVRLKGSEYDPADVNILINKNMPEKAPDIVEILKKYSTTVDQNNEFLAMMDDNQWTHEETAKWFLTNHEEIWTKWVNTEVATKVKAALK